MDSTRSEWVPTDVRRTFNMSVCDLDWKSLCVVNLPTEAVSGSLWLSAHSKICGKLAAHNGVEVTGQ